MIGLCVIAHYATNLWNLYQIMQPKSHLLTGRALPRNTSIRWRIPITLGGEMSIENMFLCRTFPNSHRLDRFIMEQTGNETLWLPNPEKAVYVTTHTATGGTGGNATSDRLSQVAAQIAKDNSLG